MFVLILEAADDRPSLACDLAEDLSYLVLGPRDEDPRHATHGERAGDALRDPREEAATCRGPDRDSHDRHPPAEYCRRVLALHDRLTADLGRLDVNDELTHPRGRKRRPLRTRGHTDGAKLGLPKKMRMHRADLRYGQTDDDEPWVALRKVRYRRTAADQLLPYVREPRYAREPLRRSKRLRSSRSRGRMSHVRQPRGPEAVKDIFGDL